MVLCSLRDSELAYCWEEWGGSAIDSEGEWRLEMVGEDG